MLRFALLLASVLALAGCGGGTGGEPAPEAGGTVGGAAAVGSTAEGDAVELAGKTVAGEQLSLAKLRGKPVFVNVWASW